MPTLQFTPAKNGKKLFFRCPKCRWATEVVSFDIEPVAVGNGEFTEKWFLKVYGVCDKCDCSGTRAVGEFTTKGNGRMIEETK